MSKGFFEQIGVAATAAANVAAYAMAANGSVDDTEIMALEVWLGTPSGKAITALSQIGGGATAFALTVKGLANSFVVIGENFVFIEDDVVEAIAKGKEHASELLKLAQFIFGADGLVSDDERLAMEKIECALTGDVVAAKELAL
jgi:hypothetical protein